MSGPVVLSRRQMLAAGGAAGVASLFPAVARAAPAPGWRMVIDPTLPAAQAAQSLAARLGVASARQGHDLASHLYGPGRDWLAPGQGLVGVTGHAGFVVAGGIARERGLPRIAGWILGTGEARALPGSPALPASLAPLADVLPADGRTILWQVQAS